MPECPPHIMDDAHWLSICSEMKYGKINSHSYYKSSGQAKRNVYNDLSHSDGHTCNSSTWQAEAEDWEFKVIFSLEHIRPF